MFPFRAIIIHHLFDFSHPVIRYASGTLCALSQHSSIVTVITGTSTPRCGGCNAINNFLNIKKAKDCAPNPNPFKFKVLKEEKLERGVILLVNYEGCTTFKGGKLLLLRCHIDLKYFGKLDPHILGDGHITCARFEPTTEGWNMARMAANCL